MASLLLYQISWGIVLGQVFFIVIFQLYSRHQNKKSGSLAKASLEIEVIDKEIQAEVLTKRRNPLN